MFLSEDLKRSRELKCVGENVCWIQDCVELSNGRLIGIFNTTIPRTPDVDRMSSPSTASLFTSTLATIPLMGNVGSCLFFFFFPQLRILTQSIMIDLILLFFPSTKISTCNP